MCRNPICVRGNTLNRKLCGCVSNGGQSVFQTENQASSILVTRTNFCIISLVVKLLPSKQNSSVRFRHDAPFYQKARSAVGKCPKRFDVSPSDYNARKILRRLSRHGRHLCDHFNSTVESWLRRKSLETQYPSQVIGVNEQANISGDDDLIHGKTRSQSCYSCGSA